MGRNNKNTKPTPLFLSIKAKVGEPLMIHPMAKYNTSPEDLKMMENWAKAKNAMPEIEVEITIDEKKLQRDLGRKVKQALDKCFK